MDRERYNRKNTYNNSGARASLSVLVQGGYRNKTKIAANIVYFLFIIQLAYSKHPLRIR